MFKEYLGETASYLGSIPVGERDELLQFYEEQFIDAGLTLEDVIEKYGTPKQFARTLKIEYFIDADNEDVNTTTAKRTKNRATMIWLIVLGLFATPILIPMAFAMLMALIGALIGFGAIVFTIYAGVLAALAGGLFTFVTGAALLTQSLPTAIFFMGTGLLATGAGVFFGPLVWRATKWLFEQFVNFAKWVGRRFLTKSPVDATA